ncbi:hypothetical protein COV11_01910 [Candidatus Woesearchaeota archaeon CG10_big_fil_rev_8_21_14_0_10_30_7]|nr:MAG: hypothetical protein COV11_01910 [Candidatus Woesearchaeota archaeon CG10_big_fil_rev_8_21_14_0_10_30_7]
MSLNVLIAEDEPALLDLFSRLMTCEGGKVTGFSSCGDAIIELSKNFNYDLIITDLCQAPSGVDVARVAICLCKNPYVVICTGETKEDKLSRARLVSNQVINKLDFLTEYKKIYSLAEQKK